MGGVTIGTFFDTPPSNGLYVLGNVGLGASAPAAKLEVNVNSSLTTPHIMMTEASTTDYARLRFRNLSGSTYWDIAGLTSATNSAERLNFYNSRTGNIMSITGDGNVGIGTTTPSSDLHILHTNGFISNGLTITDNFSSGLDWNIYSATTGQLWFSHNGVHVSSIETNGTYTVSDKRYKKDILSMGNVLEKVMKLNPSLYHFNSQKDNDPKYIGVIAQEVQPLFPEIVNEQKGANDGSDDWLSVDYSKFGVIAIKAIQEQQKVIEQKDARLNAMQAEIDELKEALAAKGILISGSDHPKSTSLTLSSARLEQNAPNPFSSTTMIRYFLPDNFSSALLTITDQNGKIIKSVKLNGPGAGQISVNAYELTSGSYSYTLSIDGRIVDTKQMVLTR